MKRLFIEKFVENVEDFKTLFVSNSFFQLNPDHWIPMENFVHYCKFYFINAVTSHYSKVP